VPFLACVSECGPSYARFDYLGLVGSVGASHACSMQLDAHGLRPIAFRL